VNALLEHLVALPIVVPLLAGAVLLLFSEEQRVARVTLALTSVALQLVATRRRSSGPTASASTTSAAGPRRSASCSSPTVCRP
jgi:hypothetical protein